MPTDKIIIVFDLGPGDGGKGGVVHALSCRNRAHTVIKVGGAQGSHGISTKHYDFAFSQWGCGTLEDVLTHITDRMIISPVGLINEAEALRHECGVMDAFSLLTVDERAICSTQYHGITSRLKEMARGANSRGTIGTGVGEARRDCFSNPDLTIRAGELKGDLSSKLSRIRDYQIAKLQGILDSEFLADDLPAVKEEMSLLMDDKYLDHNVDLFREAGRLTNIVNPEYMKRVVFNRDGTAVVESSHGVLTDNCYGLKPHVSAIRTLPMFTELMLYNNDFGGEITKIGVHRAYEIRHGAGPMPTDDSDMYAKLLPGSHKADNRYQGRVRVGPLDLVLMKYAVDVCNQTDTRVDGLAITWFDQIARNGAWDYCDRYDKFDRIEMCDKSICGSRLSRLLECEPEISSIGLPESREDQYRLCDSILRDKLGVPVNLVSFGPTECDKLMREDVE